MARVMSTCLSGRMEEENREPIINLKKRLREVSEAFRDKERHHLFKEVANCFINNGCDVFGGYVRDTLVHGKAAKEFYSSNKADSYDDPKCSPETYKDRHLAANDVDVYCDDEKTLEHALSQIGSIDGVKMCNKRALSKYCLHPFFICNYKATRVWYSYAFFRSMSAKDAECCIRFNVDCVVPTSMIRDPPYHFMCDCACNLLYINSSGVHFGEQPPDNCKFLSHGGAFNANVATSKNIVMTENKITFIPIPHQEFLAPCLELIHEAMVKLWGEVVLDDLDSQEYKDRKSKYISKYKVRFLQRVKRTWERGFTILNSPLSFHRFGGGGDDAFCNGETSCCISREDFSVGDILVKIQKTHDPEAGVIKWDSFVLYATYPTSEMKKLFGDHRWKLACPVTRRKVDVFFRTRGVTHLELGGDF